MRIVIDTAAMAHALRRWWYRWFQQPRPGSKCLDCGAALTTEERTYYGHTCERCEGIAFYAQKDASGVQEVPRG